MSGQRAQIEWLGFAYGAAGRHEEARQILAELERNAEHKFVSPQSFAIVHLGLGQQAAALGWLERACDQRAVEVLSFPGPVFESLQAEPRFRAILGRMGLLDKREYAAGAPIT